VINGTEYWPDFHSRNLLDMPAFLLSNVLSELLTFDGFFNSSEGCFGIIFFRTDKLHSSSSSLPVSIKYSETELSHRNL